VAYESGRRAAAGTQSIISPGNIYLDPVDKVMVREGYVYLRYVDDIYVFANSRVDLKEALKLLTQNCAARIAHSRSEDTDSRGP